MKAKKYLNSLINIALGAGAVIGGTYVFSRLKEKQDTETRLQRMEQILDELAETNRQNKTNKE